MPPRRHYNLNEYRFSDTRALRAVLRTFNDLSESIADINSATILCDLRDALDHPNVLTARQKETLRLNLIQGLSVNEVAAQTGVLPRTVSATVQTGLRRLLGYLQTGALPKPNGSDVWSATDLAYLKSHLKDRRPDIAMALGRSLSSIYQAISKLRNDGLLALNGKPGRPVAMRDSRVGEVPGVSDRHTGAA